MWSHSPESGPSQRQHADTWGGTPVTGCLVHCGTLGSTLGLPYQTPEHTHCDNQKREA